MGTGRPHSPNRCQVRIGLAIPENLPVLSVVTSNVCKLHLWVPYFSFHTTHFAHGWVPVYWSDGFQHGSEILQKSSGLNRCSSLISCGTQLGSWEENIVKFPKHPRIEGYNLSIWEMLCPPPWWFPSEVLYRQPWVCISTCTVYGIIYYILRSKYSMKLATYCSNKFPWNNWTKPNVAFCRLVSIFSELECTWHTCILLESPCVLVLRKSSHTFAGYGKMPKYEHIFTDFLLSLVQGKYIKRQMSNRWRCLDGLTTCTCAAEAELIPSCIACWIVWTKTCMILRLQLRFLGQKESLTCYTYWLVWHFLSCTQVLR